MIKNVKCQMSNVKCSKGFTLVELLTAVAILGIISVAAITVLNPLEQFRKGNDTKRKSDISQIQKALEVYYQDNGSYPTGASPNYIIGSTNWGSGWAPYMNVLPEDPVPTHRYIYYSSNGQTYYLYANLERGPRDPHACNGGAACTSLSGNGISVTACGATCNYGVSSPNVSP